MSISLAVGLACWGGLLLGLAGRFHVLLVAALAAAGLWLGRRAPVGKGGSDRWPWLDAAAIAVLVAALALPGYDTSLYGSDGTVYLGVGAHLARTGALAIEEPWLGKVPARDLQELFPPFIGGPKPIFARSPLGLAFRDSGPVWSTFPQLPSVWLAIGWAVAGNVGARAVTPLLAAGGVTALYLVLRRTIGAWPAAASAGLLVVSLPQVMFSRFTLGEIGAQYFVWTALLALARFQETRSRIAAVDTGLGLGLTATVRPEYLAFIPLAIVLGWVVGPRTRVTLPWPALVVMAVLWVQAAVLYLVVVPSHYLGAVAVLRDRLLGMVPGAATWWIAPMVGLVAAAAVLALATGRLRALSAGRVVRLGFAALRAGWFYSYAGLTAPGTAGRGVQLLQVYVPWPLLLGCAAGTPFLARACRTSPAARLGLLMGLVAAAHLLLDPHTSSLPVWAGRRLLPVVLPVMFAAAGAGLAAIAARRPRLAAALALAALVANARSLGYIWGRPYFQGAHQAVLDIAAPIAPDGFVVLDAALARTGLDVTLWLGLGRDAVQLSGVPGAVDRVLPLMVATAPQPAYVVRPVFVPAPPALSPTNPLRYDLVAETAIRVMLPGVESPPGKPATTLVPIQVYRVVVAPAEEQWQGGKEPKKQKPGGDTASRLPS